jgi:tetratricopeptide (TPR) repeat protein
MQKLCVILILIFAGLSTSPADEIDQKIVFYLFNAEWQKADSLLDQQMKLDPENPKYYALRLPYCFYTRYFHDGTLNNDTLIQQMADYAQKTIELVEKQDLTLENKFYLSSAYGYLTRYHIRRGEIWSTYWAARDSRRYAREILKEDPTFFDAYLTLAVMEYFTATRLSGIQASLAWVLGMMGERERALEYFRLVADSGNLCRYESMFALAAIYRFFETDYDRALPLAEKLYKQFPNNIFMVNQYREIEFVRIVEGRGIEFVKTHIDSLAIAHHIVDPGLLNRMGYSYLNQQRFTEAIALVRINIALFPAVANGYDSLAEGYMTSGDNDNAIKYYRMAYAKLPSDTTVNEDFRLRLREGIEQRLADLGAPVTVL